MKTKLVVSFALVVSLLAICSPLFAHHGNVAYDNTKIVVLKQATVTKVNWANPHILVQFDAKDDKGNVIHWVVEGGSPSASEIGGWTNTTLQPGDVVTAYVHQVKTGRPVGRFGKLMLANGKVFGSDGGLGERIANCNDESINGGNEAAACRPDGKKTANGQK
jgi:Family of unknown function (DUF6152)